MNIEEKITSILKNKNIAIIGFGREGISSYKFIRKNLGNVKLTIIDENDIRENDVLKGDKNVSFIVGKECLSHLEQFDLLLKSPGVTFKNIDDTKIRNKISSQIELVLEVYKDHVIGITGTKGKSTMSSLLYQILKANKKDSVLAGNIGIPAFDEIDLYKDSTYLVMEMSSFQIQYLNVAPHFAIILNLFIDHLNHAGDLETYHNSKLNIFKKQTKDDVGIYVCDTEPLNTKINKENYINKKYKVSFEKNGGGNIYLDKNNVIFNNEIIFTIDPEMKLKGNHVFENLMTILIICKLLNLDMNIVKDTIINFEPLPHRMEFVIEKEGVKYYNDSIATIPEATMCSITTIDDVDTLITGGSDKGSDYDKFIEFLNESNIKNIILMPDTGYALKEKLEKIGTTKKLYIEEKLINAVHLAKKITEKGKSCLMSPAAANFTEYKSYSEKGDAFKEFVKGDN